MSEPKLIPGAVDEDDVRHLSIHEAAHALHAHDTGRDVYLISMPESICRSRGESFVGLYAINALVGPIAEARARNVERPPVIAEFERLLSLTEDDLIEEIENDIANDYLRDEGSDAESMDPPRDWVTLGLGDAESAAILVRYFPGLPAELVIQTAQMYVDGRWAQIETLAAKLVEAGGVLKGAPLKRALREVQL